jgi:signal transduction histidine kinase/CheY-like chemotaxis protein
VIGTHIGLGPNDDECRQDQVRAVFDSVIYGVSAAVITAVIVAYYLFRLRLASLYVEFTWVIYISVCAACHMALYVASKGPAVEFPQGGWRTRLFLTVCLAEGLGWGATPLLVHRSANGTGELITIFATCGIGSGSVVAFGPYLPAFAMFFVTAVGPIAAILFMSPNTTLNISGLLTILYFFGMGGLGIIFNNKFKENIILKIKSDQNARDLIVQKEIVERANASKSQFLAAASHDLRQPIHAIGLYIGALRSARNDAELQSVIDKIQASLIDMDVLFSGILDISRLDAGAVKSQNVVFSIETLIDRVCGDHRLDTASRGVALRTVKCRKRVDADPIIVERILRNLISNAVRYTETGRVLVGSRRCGDQLRIEVWDTGCGIDIGHHEKVFDEFYQVQNLERDRARGLGLGLAIVKRLTKLIGSQLTLTSKLGRGSCFAFTLPLAASGSPAADEKPNFIADTQGSGLIAFVDDETAIRDAMSSVLQRWGYSVIAAQSGDELVAHLQLRNIFPDLMICDYRLRAGETGHDIIRRVRSLSPKNLPAMLITGDTAPERIAEAQSGDALVLHKPVPNGKLRAAIISLLVRQQLAKETAEHLSV